MPAPPGRGRCSPRRIIDPYASHYFAVPPACVAFMVWRFCLRVFAGAFLLPCLPLLSLVATWRLPSSPPLDSSDSGLTRCLWQETSTPASASDAARGVRLIIASKHPPLRRTRFGIGDLVFLYTTGFIAAPQRVHGVHVPSSERHLWAKVRRAAVRRPGPDGRLKGSETLASAHRRIDSVTCAGALLDPVPDPARVAATRRARRGLA